MSSDLDPSIARLNLCVPAVLGVVCHLSAPVLPESDPLCPDSALSQEAVGSCHEIPERLTADHSLLDRITHCQVVDQLTGALLALSSQQRKHLVHDKAELAVLLVLWINKVLDLSHLELSDSEKTLLWVDFVSEGETELCSCKWHLAIVELDKSSEVEEDTLSTFRSQVALLLPSRPDLACKHEVEWHSGGKRVASIWSLDVVLLNALIQFLGIVVLAILLNPEEFVSLLWLEVLLLAQYFCDVLINQFVGPMALAVLHIFDHVVCEFLNVARSLQNFRGSQASAGELKHFLLEDKMVPPQALNVVLECRSKWSIVVKARDSTIDLEGLNVEELALEEILALLTHVFLG